MKLIAALLIPAVLVSCQLFRPDPEKLKENNNAKVRELVDQLGSGELHERDAAMNELAWMGYDAVSELERQLKVQEDPEVLNRIQKVLTLAGVPDPDQAVELFVRSNGMVEFKGKLIKDVRGFFRLHRDRVKEHRKLPEGTATIYTVVITALKDTRFDYVERLLKHAQEYGGVTSVSLKAAD